MTIKELLKVAQEAVQEGFGDMPLVLETASENGDTVDTVLHRADQEMYKNKRLLKKALG